MNDTASAPKPAGPLVWLDMDQKGLDDAYDQLAYAHNRVQVSERNAFNSRRVRARLGEPRRFSYGPGDNEGLDVFATEQARAPINVFIHGGAWRQRWASEYAFLAEMFVGAGAHFAILDFTGVVEADGDLMPIADQVRRGVAWVYKNAESFGGDPERLYVSGQSSGAHLAANVVTSDWREYGVPDNIVKGALLCSGMYDLEPVALSKRSEYVNFTNEVEESLSPLRRLDRLNCPVIVGYGNHETPEFQRQARDFAAAVEAVGKPVTLLACEGYNHFEMCEMIGNPLSELGAAVLEQMGL